MKRIGPAVLLIAIALERFAFYAFLTAYILYETDRGLTKEVANAAVGTVLASVYGSTFLGSMLGQRFGFHRVPVIGALLICFAYWNLAFGVDPWCWGVALAVGIGLYKPCLPILVSMISPGDPRAMPRFYGAVNVGGLLGPLLAGLLAEHHCYQLLFELCGVLALASGVVLWMGRRHLTPDVEVVLGRALNSPFGFLATLPPEEAVRRHWKLASICALAVIFWTGYNSFFSVVEEWIKRDVDRVVMSWSVPVAWFNAENGLVILILGVLAPRWMAGWRLSTRLVGSLALATATFVVLAIAAGAGPGRCGVGLVAMIVMAESIAELMISPLALSTITSLAPPKFLSVYMALWYASSALGGWLSGQLTNFWTIAGLSLSGVAVAWLLKRKING